MRCGVRIPDTMEHTGAMASAGNADYPTAAVYARIPVVVCCTYLRE
jgi:hypothetical protein